jgi:excisionase family DNA binding protein
MSLSQIHAAPEASPVPRHIGRSELARQLGVSTRTVDKLVRQGRLPRPFRLGAKSVFRAEQVLAALERLREGPTDE